MLGTQPQIAAAMSLFNTMLTMGILTALFNAFGFINWEYAAWIGAFTAWGSLLGVIGADLSLKAIPRLSLVTLGSLIFMLGSVVVTGYFGVTNFNTDLELDLGIGSFDLESFGLVETCL